MTKVSWNQPKLRRVVVLVIRIWCVLDFPSGIYNRIIFMFRLFTAISWWKQGYDTCLALCQCVVESLECYGYSMVFNATFNDISVIYRGGQFYWWRKPEYPEKTTDPPQVKPPKRALTIVNENDYYLVGVGYKPSNIYLALWIWCESQVWDEL